MLMIEVISGRINFIINYLYNNDNRELTSQDFIVSSSNDIDLLIECKIKLLILKEYISVFNF